MGSPRKASSRAMYKASSIAGDEVIGAVAAVVVTGPLARAASILR
ncbi:MAG: hypothetical protein RI898_1381 [Actinomycetota bacterium]